MSSPTFPFDEHNEIHVWSGQFSVMIDDRDPDPSNLSSEEMERASRFVFDRDRTRYIVARNRLRVLLGQYLETDPAEIRLAYNTYGKPALDREQRESLLFNLAHAGDWLCIAVCRDVRCAEGDKGSQPARPVLLGLDVELTRRDIPFLEVAQSHFSPREVEQLRSADGHARPFFRCWTRKEAYIKAHGSGVSYGLDRFGVSMDENEVSQPSFDMNDDVDISDWTIYSWDPAPDYFGALAINRVPVRIAHWRLETVESGLPLD